MNILVLGAAYVIWLYREGVWEFLRGWMNYHWFLYHFFSVGIIVPTLFSPWHRMQERKKRGFDPQQFAERAILNIVLRCVGFVMRSIVLLLALLSQCALLLLGAFLFIAFLTSPLFIPAAFFTGLLLFFV